MTVPPLGEILLSRGTADTLLYVRRRLMKLEHRRLLLASILLLLGIFYIGNALTGHRLAYAIYVPELMLGSWITAITKSPSGRYSAAIESDGMQGLLIT
jgi:hypothetical protein